jgi:hypothetical protein
MKMKYIFELIILILFLLSELNSLSIQSQSQSQKKNYPNLFNKYTLFKEKIKMDHNFSNKLEVRKRKEK